MTWISEQYRPWIVYSACTLISIAVFTSNLRGGVIARKLESFFLLVLSPVYSVVDYSTTKTREFWNNYLFLIDLKRQNIALDAELTDMKSHLITLSEEANSAKRFREILELPTIDSFRPIVAEVVRKRAEPWETIFLINAGSFRGIKLSMGVTTVDGVVGQVIRVAPRISKVMTMLHPKSGIAGMLEKSRISGVVSGTGHGTCIMKFVSRFERVMLGEHLVTSGLDGAFPKGIPIGVVNRIEKDPEEIFQSIEIVPFVEFASVEEVILYEQTIIEDLP